MDLQIMSLCFASSYMKFCKLKYVSKGNVQENRYYFEFYKSECILCDYLFLFFYLQLFYFKSYALLNVFKKKKHPILVHVLTSVA